ncbi:uncharacterized protein RCH25_009256 [Pelodytes ibericus]
MSVSTARLGDLSVTTRVLPASDTGAAALTSGPQYASQAWTPAITQKFKKLHTKALSVVLILTGVLQICFGVMMSIAENEYPSLAVRSGVYIWGGLVVLAAGCITVPVETMENINMIKACLGSHVTNLVVGGVALILYIVQLYTETQACWANYEQYNQTGCVSLYNNQDFHQQDYYYYVSHNYVAILRVSVSSVVLIFSLLGLIVSICVVGSGWKVLKDARYSLLVQSYVYLRLIYFMCLPNVSVVFRIQSDEEAQVLEGAINQPL